MKTLIKFSLILLLGFFAFKPKEAQASHMVGGEITWVCQANGTYIFKMEIYRECTGTSFFFNTQTISYPGGSIVMKPDSNRWLTYGAGNISPEGPSGCKRSCDSPSQIGATQFFPYISDPVNLNGVPPPGGWLFTWGPVCCRPSSVANLTTPSSRSFTLRAKMYPFQGRNTNNCYDSSPKFDELPAVLICKGYDFIFNHNASDNDLDSLVYSWAFPWDNANVPVDFAPGYAYNSPMPGTAAHPKNKPAQLNRQTGEIKFGTYSGQSGQQYASCIQVDAYRCGVKIATVFRDIPFILFDCPTLPGTGFTNNPPTAMVNGVPAIGYVDTVYAGEKISLPFQSTENDIVYTDPADPTTARLQQNFLSPSGFMFSNDFVDPTACKTTGIAPCATLTPPPQINPTNGKYELTNQGTVTSLFEWQTTCDHLNAEIGCTETGGTYNFVMKTYDDHCDVPGIIYPSISIHVLAPPTVGPPEIRGASVELDGKLKLYYKKPPPPNSTLEEYELYYGYGSATATPSTLSLFNGYGNITNFDGPLNVDYPVVDYLNYRWMQDANYNYIAMRSMSGCDGTVPSEFGDTVRIPRTKVEPAGPAGASRSKAKVTWDFLRNPASEMLPSASKLYRVWANYPVSTPQDIMDSSNWVLLGSTMDHEYIVPNALACNEFVAFRVEMMDTLRKDSIISYFASIDTLFMAPDNVAPTPLIDSVSVDMNGNVYVGITPGRPVSKHEIYDVTNGTPGVLVATLYGENFDTLLPGQNADMGVRKYNIVAYDTCFPGLTGESVVHNTIKIDSVSWKDMCAGTMEVYWNAYNGWPTQNNAVTYDLLFSTTGPTGPFQSAGSTNGTSIIQNNVLGQTTYYYKVYAYDNMGHHSTSAIFTNTTEAKPSPEVVPAPTLLCARVMQPSGVELEWMTPVDSTSNRKEYEFQYRLSGGNWQTVTITDTSKIIHSFMGVDANSGVVEFRARTISDSCGIDVYSAFSDILPTIYVEAKHQLKSTGETIYNAGEINWNTLVVDSVHPYTLEREFEGSASGFNMMYRGPQNYQADPGAAYCDTLVRYRVTIQDTSGCMNISSIDEIRYYDNEIPNMQPIDYVSYERNTGELYVKWSLKPMDSPDVDSVSLVIPDPNDPSVFEEIKTVPWSDLEMRALHPSIDASFDVTTVALQAIDACGKNSVEFDYHSTIDVDAQWDTCAKTFTLTWNPYETYRTSGDVVYTIYYSEDNVNYMGLGSPAATTKDNQYTGSIPNFKESQTYYFYVESKDQDGMGNFISNSNVDSILTLVESMPRFTYLRTATVNSPSQVQVDGFVDDSVAVSRYNIYRGIYRQEMSRVGSVLPTEVDNRNFSYLDNSANAESNSYYYYIQVESPCGNYLDTSNIGRSIHLTVEENNERVANILRWNAYEGWDTTVAYYNVYRGVDGVFDFLNVHAKVDPVSGIEQEYVDNVINESYSLGRYCYVIEAIEGPVKPELASFITSATSRSNYACADMEPIFYIPNAFSPSGMNKVFRPEGQFLDYKFYELVVYNRWGEKVFETRDYFEGWDGTFNGEPAQDGTYVYTIRFKGADGKEHSKKGTVTLIR